MNQILSYNTRQECSLRTLFVLPKTLSFAYTGGTARYTANYLALCELGLDVYVLRVNTQESYERIIKFDREHHEEFGFYQKQASGWDDFIYKLPEPKSFSQRLTHAIIYPFEHTYPEAKTIAQKLETSIDSISPDFVWLETFPAVPAGSLLKQSPPQLLSLHDWPHKLHLIRSQYVSLRQRLKKQIFSWSHYRADKLYLRKGKHFLTGSTTQADDIKRMTGKQVFVIPQTYPPIYREISTQPSQSLPNIVHIGGLRRTTANIIGLTDYFKYVFPKLNQQSSLPLKHLIIGEDPIPESEVARLLADNSIDCKGFVYDLSEYIQPYDIAIIPYMHATGFRTKLALYFNYGLVTVATKASVQGMPEVVDRENCILVDSLEEFADAIDELVQKPDLRMYLVQNAHHTFKNKFALTSKETLSQYQKVVNCLTDY